MFESIFFLTMVMLLCGWQITVRLLPPVDRRTLAEKNWDWIMGPELPSTCSQIGHSYAIDPHECDWCGAERYLQAACSKDESGGWQSCGWVLPSDVEVFTIVGQAEKLAILPAKATVTSGGATATAGSVLDGTVAAVSSSKDEARQEAKEAAARLSERNAEARRHEARRESREAQALSRRYSPPSYPRGSDLTHWLGARPDAAHRRDYLDKLYRANLISRENYRDLMEREFRRNYR